MHRRAFDPWWQYAREEYLDLAGTELPTETTLYYDPVLDVHHRLPASLALTTSYYAAPQRPDDARRLFDAACRAAGFDKDIVAPLRASRGAASALILAREWEIDDVGERLGAAIEDSFEPTWDDTSGEFTWGLGLDEPHPRGQLNALLAAAEAVGPGRWEALSAAPLEPCPQIVDVDLANVVLSRAEWEGETLRLTLDPLRPDPTRSTEFRIVGVEPRIWWVNGIENVTTDVRADCVVVRCPLVAGELEFTPSSY